MAKIIPLQKSGIFQSLSDHELVLFSRVVAEEKREAGAVLVDGKMVSDRFFFIEKGKVVLTAPNLEDGGELVLGVWDTFGEWALLGPEHLSSVMAMVTEPSNILVVQSDDFEQFSRDQPAIAIKVQRDLLAKVWESIQSVSEVLGVAGEETGE